MPLIIGHVLPWVYCNTLYPHGQPPPQKQPYPVGSYGHVRSEDRQAQFAVRVVFMRSRLYVDRKFKSPFGATPVGAPQHPPPAAPPCPPRVRRRACGLVPGQAPQPGGEESRWGGSSGTAAEQVVVEGVGGAISYGMANVRGVGDPATARTSPPRRRWGCGDPVKSCLDPARDFLVI
jgi:hypothetical protein